MSRHGCLPRSRRSATSDFSSPRSRDRRHRRFGQGAYRGIHEKAAALLHSFARSHALVDGNKRLGWLATATFLELNGVTTTRISNDDVYSFVMAVAAGARDPSEGPAELAAALRRLPPRRRR